jgi:hypothetical protein
MDQKGVHREIQKPTVVKTGKHCPFVESPSDDCFVVGIDSVSAEKAIYYCGRNFDECNFYWKRIKREPP